MRILWVVLIPPAVLLYSLVQTNSRLTNIRAQYGAFLDEINEVPPMEPFEDKVRRTPALKEDPTWGPSGSSLSTWSTSEATFWIIYLYFKLNRPTYTGILSPGTSRLNLQAQLQSPGTFGR